METQKIQIYDDEIVVNVTTKKAKFWGIIVSIILVSVFSLSSFLGYYDHILHSNIIVVLGFATGLFLSSRYIFWQPKKQYTVTFDKKHIVLYNNLYQGKAYKMENIRNWYINPNHRLTVWAHIGAFFTKGAGGCIVFNFADMKMPIKIGYGLTPSEAEELSKALQEKGWISDFQLSDTAIEHKKNEKMKYIMLPFFSLFSIGLILIYFLKEPYKKDFFFIQVGILLMIALFCFVMAIVTYRQDKKHKKRMLNA